MEVRGTAGTAGHSESPTHKSKTELNDANFSSFKHLLVVIIVVVVLVFLVVFVLVVVVIVHRRGLLGHGPAGAALLAGVALPRAPLGPVGGDVLRRKTRLNPEPGLFVWVDVEEKNTGTFSYFSFSLAALASYGTLSLELWVAHSSPSFLAMSPMEMPGFSSLMRGRWSEQKTKKAELEEKAEH